MIDAFYDQTHPKASVGRIAGFRKVAKKSKKTTKTTATKTRTRGPKHQDDV